MKFKNLLHERGTAAPSPLWGRWLESLTVEGRQSNLHAYDISIRWSEVAGAVDGMATAEEVVGATEPII
ncbi:hypothetical protein CRG98_040305 [Punica granatum]|uniref:Uncharacterized protein n=1 Tax=Punica granatum TaxID=22663 RepID=A0A2I0I5N9_PUNGR|nr:hypothetical protein CRG98_040305 [Punica granatum]